MTPSYCKLSHSIYQYYSSYLQHTLSSPKYQNTTHLFIYTYLQACRFEHDWPVGAPKYAVWGVGPLSQGSTAAEPVVLFHAPSNRVRLFKSFKVLCARTSTVTVYEGKKQPATAHCHRTSESRKSTSARVGQSNR